MTDTIKRLAAIFSVFFLIALYLYLRVGFRDTIEFGYDQPRNATWVVSMMENGDYLDALRYIGLNPFGQRSVYTLFYYFLVPFFAVSTEPVFVSVCLAVFNILGVLFLYLLAKELFNLRVALISSVLLITFPWHVIFSRMIYVPSVMTTAVIFGYYLLVLIKKGKKWAWTLLFPALSFSLQTYVVGGATSTLAIIVLSTSYLRRQSDLKKILAGVLIGLLLWLPVIRYDFLNNHVELLRIISQPKVFGGQSYIERSFLVLKHFLEVASSSDFKFQLGYAYDDFMRGIWGGYVLWSALLKLITVSALGYLIATFFRKRDFKSSLVLLWIFAPLVLLFIYKVTDVLPRYFLVTLPAVFLAIGVFLDRFFKRLIFIFCIMTIIVNVYFMRYYYDFVLNYQGYHGLLSGYSDPPIYFVRSALQFVIDDAKKAGYQYVTVSYDPAVNDRFGMDGVETYMWRNVFKRDEVIPKGVPALHYFVTYESEPSRKDLSYKRFGPYIVYPNYGQN